MFLGLRRFFVLGVFGIFIIVVLLVMEVCGGVLVGFGLMDEKLERLIRVEGLNWFIMCRVLDFRL